MTCWGCGWVFKICVCGGLGWFGCWGLRSLGCCFLFGLFAWLRRGCFLWTCCWGLILWLSRQCLYGPCDDAILPLFTSWSIRRFWVGDRGLGIANLFNFCSWSSWLFSWRWCWHWWKLHYGPAKQADLLSYLLIYPSSPNYWAWTVWSRCPASRVGVLAQMDFSYSTTWPISPHTLHDSL